MDNQVWILHPSPINPSPLVAGNPRMAAAAIDAFFFLLNLVCFICSAQSASTYRFLRPRRDATLFPSHPNTTFWNTHSMFLESYFLSGRVEFFWTCCVLILFFLQCIICSARTHVLKMLGLAITEYTSLMVTVKTSHGYYFRVGFMNQEDRCFFMAELG